QFEGLAVGPMQILEHDDKGLLFALFEEQGLDRIQRAPGRWAGSSFRQASSSTDKSKSERRAGSADLSDSPSARTLPVTFSRTLRASSRASMRKYDLKSSMTGSQAVAWPYDTDLPSRMSKS